jgi:soluble lytic murein transglycosylase
LLKKSFITFLLIFYFISLISCIDEKNKIEEFKKLIINSKGNDLKKTFEDYKNIDPELIVFDDPQLYYIVGKLYFNINGIDKWTYYFLKQGILQDNLFKNESLDLLIRSYIEKNEFNELKNLIKKYSDILNSEYKDILLNFLNEKHLSDFSILQSEKKFFPLYFNIIKNNTDSLKQKENQDKIIKYFINMDIDKDYFKNYMNEINEIIKLSENNPLLIIISNYINDDKESFKKNFYEALNYSFRPDELYFLKQISIEFNERKLFYNLLISFSKKNKWFRYHYIMEKANYENSLTLKSSLENLIEYFPEHDNYNYYIRSKLLYSYYNFNPFWISDVINFINDYPKSSQSRALLSLMFRSSIYQKKESILIPYLKQIKIELMGSMDQSIYYYLSFLIDKKNSLNYLDIIKKNYPLSYANLILNNGEINIQIGNDEKNNETISSDTENILKKLSYYFEFNLTEDAEEIDYDKSQVYDRNIILQKFYDYYNKNGNYYEAAKNASEIAYYNFGDDLINADIETLKELFPLYYREYIEKYSKEFSVDIALCYAVMREESFFNKDIISFANAVGLMQIMPSTGNFIADRLKMKNFDLTNPEDNIKMGIYYLRYLSNIFSSNQLVISAYNGGQGRTKQYINTYKSFPEQMMYELIPNEETRHYIRKVMRSYYIYKYILSMEKN